MNSFTATTVRLSIGHSMSLPELTLYLCLSYSELRTYTRNVVCHHRDKTNAQKSSCKRALISPMDRKNEVKEMKEALLIHLSGAVQSHVYVQAD